jgi:hypothetical protein
MNLYDKAIEIIERGWTKGAAARDCNGESCGVDSPDAVAWCLMGAMVLAETELKMSAHWHRELRNTLRVENLRMGLATFNDSCESKDEVIALIRKTRDEQKP